LDKKRDKTLKSALKRRREMFKRRMEIRIKKCHDYAGDKNVYQNFERVARLIKDLKIDTTTTHGCCLFYVILKLDRTCNLLFSGKKPECESLEDTVAIDGPNYWDLLDEILWVSGYYDEEEDKCPSKQT